MAKFKLLAAAAALALTGSRPAFGRAKTCEAWLRPAPLQAQETEFTCGVACARSLIRHFRGLNYPETVLAQSMGTYRYGYTPLASLHRVLRSFRLHSRIATGLRFEDLSHAGREGEALIVCITLGGEPHYALLRAVSPTHVVLMDPWTARHRGDGYRLLTRRQFERSWSFTLDGMTLKHAVLRVWP
jgi:predicted double-glycine peptidase